jgi:spore coat polysaccharide biosynthesis protein SpsF
MKLAAVLACRNQSSRLYAKPLQNLDVKNNVSILDYMITQLKKYLEIDDVVLAISDNEENSIYTKIAKLYNIPYILGDDNDVLGRLIKGADLVRADHVFRVTTESPYTYMNNLPDIYMYHHNNNIDYSVTKGLPDGSYFEIISVNALKKSWDEGSKKHRSELCSLYIFENTDKFKLAQHNVPQHLRRNDIRLTVDWPEDLIVLRKVYEDLKLSPEIKLDFEAVIKYLDENPRINAINNWIDSGIGRVWS